MSTIDQILYQNQLSNSILLFALGCVTALLVLLLLYKVLTTFY